MMTRVTCLPSGSWDAAPPDCLKIVCPDIYSLVNFDDHDDSDNNCEDHDDDLDDLDDDHGHADVDQVKDADLKVTVVSNEGGGKIAFSCPQVKVKVNVKEKVKVKDKLQERQNQK